MKRPSLLLAAALAIAVTGCGGTSSTPAAASGAGDSVQPPSSAPAASPSMAPVTPAVQPSSAPASAGSDVPLTELLPDTIGGNPPDTDLDLVNDPKFSAIFGSLGGEQKEGVEYVIRIWDDLVTVSAIRIPDMPEPQLAMMAQALAGAVPDEDGSADMVSIGGKDVVRIKAEDHPDEVAYTYFGAGAMFTVLAESEDAAAEAISKLP